jgi:hypothetical protein
VGADLGGADPAVPLVSGVLMEPIPSLSVAGVLDLSQSRFGHCECALQESVFSVYLAVRELIDCSRPCLTDLGGLAVLMPSTQRVRDLGCLGGGPGWWLHGRIYGEQRGCGGGLSLRSCGWRGADGGGSWCWRRFGFGSSQIAVRGPNSGTTGGEFSGAVRGFFRTKAQRFGANDGDACGCRILLGSVVVVILPVKPLTSRS